MTHYYWIKRDLENTNGKVSRPFARIRKFRVQDVLPARTCVYENCDINKSVEKVNSKRHIRQRKDQSFK